ncbi:heme exporter protein CcmD [Arenibaculum pallidiluteum]|uniref:heme exporter protein CcmD n=1 Tax=Arenibaculum pallidiluteum TaxID=2812559 RepID=UPI001A969CF1|nr:heme exporter protein CcmD [Arenibaculum pallidiluteum]
MTEFLSMGGYAAYVWPSYAIAAIVLLGLLVSTLRGLRRSEALLRALEGERPRRRRAAEVNASAPLAGRVEPGRGEPRRAEPRRAEP